MTTPRLCCTLLAAFQLLASAPQANQVLVVVNRNTPVSTAAADYYVKRRGVPDGNVCTIAAPTAETIAREVYEKDIAQAVERCLRSRSLVETVLYIVTTSGVPLRIDGKGGRDGDFASVDSELTLLYARLHGQKPPLAGPLTNPFFGKRDAPFRHPQFPMYLVTRLTAYDLATVRAMIDRCMAAKNVGKFVIDARSGDDKSGDRWLRDAAILLPDNRLVFEESERVLYGQRDVIGYASWGSNDPNRKQRRLGFKWLPGAIMTEFVSTNARTFERPPGTWNLSNWNTPKLWFAGSPQTLIGDVLEEGASGAAGHVFEPYLGYTPRPDYLLPAWYAGRTLAEAYYLAIPALSWQNVVAGDPLCSLGPPAKH